MLVRADAIRLPSANFFGRLQVARDRRTERTTRFGKLHETCRSFRLGKLLSKRKRSRLAPLRADIMSWEGRMALWAFELPSVESTKERRVKGNLERPSYKTLPRNSQLTSHASIPQTTETLDLYL